VVTVGRVATAVDHLALLAERSLLAEIVVGAVQVVDRLGDHDAFGILPGTVADAVARVDRAGALRAQISPPGLAGGAGGLRELGAAGVGAGQSAEIGALAGAGAGDEEGHRRLLRSDRGARGKRDQRSAGKRGQDQSFGHGWSPDMVVANGRRLIPPASDLSTTLADVSSLPATRDGIFPS